MKPASSATRRTRPEGGGPAAHSRASYFVGITGGSGSAYAVRLIEELLLRRHPVSLSISPSGAKVIRHEISRSVDVDRFRPADLLGHDAPLLRYYRPSDLEAPASSGTSAPLAAIIVPCSGGTMAAVAAGSSDNLIRRVADATLKERGKLILVPRETPLSVIHIENWLRAARAGAIVLPAMPAFYTRPRTLDDAVAFVVGKILDQLGLDHTLFPRWNGPAADRPT